MARRPQNHKARAPFPLTLVLDPSASLSLQRQLYAAIRNAILEGRLAPGVRLQGTRPLAESLEVSRTTVALVFDQLRAEGYLEGRARTGTLVSRVRPEAHLSATDSRVRRAPSPLIASAALVSQRGAMLASLRVTSSSLHGSTASRAFRLGTPALDHFPLLLWGRLLARRWRSFTASQLSDAESHPYPPLRAAIAAYVAQTRRAR